ncbi:VWA domain-containing protein [Egicoccus sp. AB-alg2]|uniref:VWA domain-containing protein n=1 Tax=Egicoccus sp. AB-alg2 TaxID=3242693 RepID=UPI00359E46F9
MSWWPLHLDTPAWLAALAVVPLVLWLGWRHAGDRDRALRRATALRALAVGLLVLALAGPRWDAAGRAVDLVVVVDASDSTLAARAEAQAWISAATVGQQRGDRLAVAAVGRDAQVEHGLREQATGGALTVRVDGSETDLARGLRLAQGLAGSEQRRRVVLLTDGFATRGDAAQAIRELEDAGIPVDVVPLGSDGGIADVLIEGVRVPSRVRQGDAYDVTVVMTNTGTAPAGATVVVSADGEEIHREAVELPPGRSELRVPRTAERTDETGGDAGGSEAAGGGDGGEAGNGDGTARGGAIRYEARLESAASIEPRNDLGVAAVQVEGPASVLVVDGSAGGEGGGHDADELVRLLEAGGLPVTRHPVDAGFPPLDRLLGHDATILVDVHADEIGEPGAVALDAYVRDAGRGLVVVGGEQSYGVGGYDGTRLEELLPVFARIQDPQRRPSVAQALVVDVSGSMGACHCRPDGFGGGPVAEEGGPNKTDISREAVARAIENLDAQDTVGVLAFHTEAEWVLPLQQLPDQAIVDDALGSLFPNGDTSIGQALEEAIAGLKDADARLRHIVLFTDGFTSESGLEDIAAEAAEQGITVSVVGTGEGTDDVLERMAEVGGGRFYPGRDLSSIPSVLASEVQMVSRPLIEEGRFTPIVTAVDEVTAPLTESPPLLGYVATTAKPTARTLLRIGDERDPLLATWQAGLGTVAAWTSDATTRWSAPWSGWDGARDLWGALVRSTLPADEGGAVDVRADVTSDGLELGLTSAEALPGDVTATAIVVDPDGSRREVPLTRSDLDAFEATVPAGGNGVHAVTILLERGGTEVARRTVTAVRSYPAEYAASTGSREAAQALVGDLGRFDPDPALAFTREGTTPGSTPRDLTGPLLLLALLTLPVDVGLRRLRLERGDLRQLLRRRTPAARPAAASGATALAGSRAAARAAEATPPPVWAAPGGPPRTSTTTPDGLPPTSTGTPDAPRPTATGTPEGAPPTAPATPDRPQARPPARDPDGPPPPPVARKDDGPAGGAGGASRLLEARRRARGGDTDGEAT